MGFTPILIGAFVLYRYKREISATACPTRVIPKPTTPPTVARSVVKRHLPL